MLSLSPILDLLLPPLLENHHEADSAHDSFRYLLYGACIAFWALAALVAMVLRCGSDLWRERMVRWQQGILALIILLFILGATLPVLISSPAEVAAGFRGAEITYVDGRWHVVVASTGAAIVACSGLSPPLFGLLELTAFTLWEARNHVLRLAVGLQAVGTAPANSTLRAGPAELEQNILVAASIHYALIAPICFLVSYQRDRLVRQNFVILQLVKSRRDRTISELRGEKQQLELMLAVEKAQSEASAHIKIMTNFSPRQHKRQPVTRKGNVFPRPPLDAATKATESPAASSCASISSSPATSSTVTSTASQGGSPEHSRSSCEPRAPSANGDRRVAHVTRLLAASDLAHAVRDEIGLLTEALDEEMDDHGGGHDSSTRREGEPPRLMSSLGGPGDGSHIGGGGAHGTFSSAFMSGRSVDWHAREHSPLHGRSAVQLVRPSPRPVRDIQTSTQTQALGPDSGGRDPLTAMPVASAGRPEATTASPFDFFSGRGLGFRMPTAHQEAVASDAETADGLTSA